MIDTREKLEADICQWLDSRLIGNEVFETVISWINRQAEITAQAYIEWVEKEFDIAERESHTCPHYDSGRHYCKCYDHGVVELQAKVDGLQAKVDELTKERDELRAKIDIFGEEIYHGGTIEDWYESAVKQGKRVDELDAKVDELTEERDLLLEQIEEYAEEAANFEQSLADFEQTHMRLPVDADGVPIHVGDVVAAQDEQPFEVRAFQLDTLGWFAIERLGSQWNVNQLRHVQKDTVESLLEEFTLKMTENMGMYTAESIEADEWKRLDEETIAEYAERIRRSVEHG